MNYPRLMKHHASKKKFRTDPFSTRWGTTCSQGLEETENGGGFG